MFLLRFFRFLTGFVVFEGKGGFPERFLNLCSLNGINVWDAHSSSGTFTAKTNISCYKKIRPCAKRSGMKLKAIRKCGLPFLIMPYKKRKGLLVGAVLSAIIVSVLSSCIWTVNVTGNEKYTDGQIIAIAEAYGVRPGAFRSRIDAKAVRESIKANTDSINWFSVNIDNTAVTLEVLENSGNNEILDLAKPCNYVSTVDGELIKLEVYTGQAALTVGNAVTAGELLISGVVERADGSSDFVHARGNAVIRTKKEVTESIHFSEKCSRPDNMNKRYSLYLFSLKIPLAPSEENDITRTESAMMQYNFISLPLGVITHKSFSLNETDMTLNKAQATLLCEQSLFCKEREIMKNALTESKRIKITYSENSVTSTASYINHEKSGIEYYFDVEGD